MVAVAPSRAEEVSARPGVGEVHNEWGPVHLVDFREASAKIKLPPGRLLSPEAVVHAIIPLSLSEGLSRQGSLTVHAIAGPAPREVLIPWVTKGGLLQFLITPSIPVLSVDISATGISKNLTGMQAPDGPRYLSVLFIAISRVLGPY